MKVEWSVELWPEFKLSGGPVDFVRGPLDLGNQKLCKVMKTKTLK